MIVFCKNGICQIFLDFLTHSLKKNTGQVDQYYVKNSHPAIIDKDIWEAVQEELERREEFCKTYHLKKYGYRSNQVSLIGKIICGQCGYAFARKSWSTRGVLYWQCKSENCKGHIKEETLNQAFVTAWNHVVRNRDKFMTGWQEETPFKNIRAKHMIELISEGTIKSMVSELMQMVLEKIVVHDLEHYMVCMLLRRHKKEILI